MNSGAKLVDEAGVTMDEIVVTVKRVTEIVAEITEASREQSAGIEQVNQAITHMDEATQQNAALVEEAAAAAESLQEQAGNLVQAVSVFKLARDAHDMPIAKADVAEVKERRGPNRAVNVARLPGKAPTVRRAASPSASQPVTSKKAAGNDEDWQEF